ncbi:MAG: DUF4340 domain-containing protein [Brevinema sp.]
MKKQSVLTVGILLVLSIICFIYVTNRSKSGVSDRYPWADARKDALVSLEITDSRPNSPRKFILSMENGVLGVFKPIHYATSPDRIAIFATTFMNLKPKNMFTNVSPEEFNAYGLNTPQLRINVSIKGQSDTTLLLGTSTTLGGDVYTALENNRNVVYLLAAQEASILLGGMNMLLYNAPYSVQVDNATQVFLRNNRGEDWDFIKTNGFWVQHPSMETNKDWGMRRFLLQAKDLSFETNVILYDLASSELSNLGVDTNTSPYISLRYEDSSSYSIFIGREDEGFYQAYIPEMTLGVMISSVFVNRIFGVSLNDLAATRRQ